MPKEQLKEAVIDAKGPLCALTGVNVGGRPFPHMDTHRTPPKAKNGAYSVDTTDVVDPVAHMQAHWNHRERDAMLEEIKAMVDDRNQIMRLHLKVENQIRAAERRTDILMEDTMVFLKEQAKFYEKAVAQRTRNLSKTMANFGTMDPLSKAALGVRGIGPVTVALCRVYIDLEGKFPVYNPITGNPHPRAGQEKARHASSLWKYVGLDKSSHERYEKGVAGGGNKTLRTALYNMACSQIKTGGPYKELYLQVKERLSKSEKVVKSRNTQGKLVEVAWKDTKPSHRHGAALRAVMKHFLADYWYVGRHLAGLPNGPCYAEAVLGGGHRTIMPEERGWIY